MKNREIEPTTLAENPSWAGDQPIPGGVFDGIETEYELPNDPRIMPEYAGIPAAMMGPGPTIPDEIPLTYGLHAKVLLPRPAFNFKVEHDLPMDVILLECKPKATIVGEHLIWNLGRLDPGQELRLQVTVMPEPGAKFNVGELTNFNATYTQNLYFQTPLIRPRLNLRVSGPDYIRVGEIAEYTVETHNIGNWSVEHVRTTLVLPDFLEVAPGSPTFDIGRLPPSTSRTFKFFARAVEAGEAKLRVEANGTPETRFTAEFVTTIVS